MRWKEGLVSEDVPKTVHDLLLIGDTYDFEQMIYFYFERFVHTDA